VNIGFFTDTYYPQVSGVAASIQTLKIELEKLDHKVYIFTTTDPKASDEEDPTIIRMPSVPFVSFSERRLVIRGMIDAYLIASKLELDIIHTHTEFGVGILGKIIAGRLKVPIIHTFHTMYEDYLHYIAGGKVVKPSMVKYYSRAFMHKLNGIICPSDTVRQTLQRYGIMSEKRIIPTGINLSRFVRPEITEGDLVKLKEELGVSSNQVMLLSLSRISYEKNIHLVVKAMPDILAKLDVKLVIVGDGPYLGKLKELVTALGIEEHVVFTGMINGSSVAYYYRAADFLVSASTSETQGLTYTESIATGTPIIAWGNPYLEGLLDNPFFGRLFYGADEIAETVLLSARTQQKIPQELLNQKLSEISSENFAKTVYEYYLDVLISFSRAQERKELKAISKKITGKIYSIVKRD
jgi:1,2-diacylglycerol 3-alpha-glucosyltransferase